MSEPDNKIPKEVLDVLGAIMNDGAEMQKLIDHGVEHAPPSEVWDEINDLLEGRCEVGNAMMLLSLLIDTLSGMELSVPQQSLLIGMYAAMAAAKRIERDKDRDKETDPTLS